jgi:ferredoxin
MPMGARESEREGTGKTMKIVVDFDVCEANAICVGMAPDVFDVDDNDYLNLLQDEVPESRREEMEAVVRACPKRAISIAD